MSANDQSGYCATRDLTDISNPSHKLARCKFAPPWGSSPLRPAAHARLHEPRRQQLRHSVNSRRPGLATRSWNEDRSDLSGSQEWTRLPRLEVPANPTT